MRRLSSTLTRSAESGSPAGIPSRTATRPRPCDSPAVVNRNVTLAHLRYKPPPASTNLHRPPQSFHNSTRARLRAGLSRFPGRSRDEASPSRRHRVRVDELCERDVDHHEPVRGDAEQELPCARRVARHPERPDDRIADRDREGLAAAQELAAVERIEHVDARVRPGGEKRSEEHTAELQYRL